MYNKKKTTKRTKRNFQMDIKKTETKIDNEAPKFILETYLKSRHMLADTERIKVLDKENLELIQRLNLIYRTNGKVDSTIPKEILYKSKLLETIKEENKIIMKENKKVLKEILSTKATYSTIEFLRDWKRIEGNMERTSKYPLFWKNSRYYGKIIRDSIIDDIIPPGIKTISKKRSHCFFDIELSESKEYLGRIVFELYNDFVPTTCANFYTFCKGTEAGLSYKGTPFHRIVPGYWCQGGDVTKFNGTGGTSIYGDKFKDENFTLLHRGPGIISSWSHGPNTNNSKFNITFDSLPTMDKKRVVFGKVIHGLSNLYKIEEMGCKTGKPMKNIIISKCGVLPKKNWKEI